LSEQFLAFLLYSHYGIETMFEVRITEAARAMLDGRPDRGDRQFGLMVRRLKRTADNFRDSSGHDRWTFEERHPWEILVTSIPEDAQRVLVADGIKVYLPFISAASEPGITITVKEGRLHVETIDA
jgi:hypothetical protein